MDEAIVGCTFLFYTFFSFFQVPLLITLLILAHMALPVFHAFSIYIIYCFYKIHICIEVEPSAENGLTIHQTDPTKIVSDSAASLLSNGQDETTNIFGRDPQKPRLCYKCQMAYDENEDYLYRCTSTPLLRPIETTC